MLGKIQDSSVLGLWQAKIATSLKDESLKFSQKTAGTRNGSDEKEFSG